MTESQIDEMLDDLGIVDDVSPEAERERYRAIVRRYLEGEQ